MSLPQRYISVPHKSITKLKTGFLIGKERKNWAEIHLTLCFSFKTSRKFLTQTMIFIASYSALPRESLICSQMCKTNSPSAFAAKNADTQIKFVPMITNLENLFSI